MTHEETLARDLPRILARLRLALTDRLSLSDWLIVTIVLLAVGTVYCQIYCLVALQKMDGSSMPLLSSVVRVGVDIVPPFAAFELAKRVPLRARFWQWLLVVLIFSGAFSVAVLVRSNLSIMSTGLTVRRIAADRIPSILLALTALTYFHLRPSFASRSAGLRRVSDQPDQMPPAAAIVWIKAAGNYVEVNAHGRVRLIRITLRQIADMLPAAQFVQIHRSVIINRARLAVRRGRKSVEMTDGTVFNVGDAYRSNLSEG